MVGTVICIGCCSSPLGIRVIVVVFFDYTSQLDPDIMIGTCRYLIEEVDLAAREQGGLV